jgi:hypothetical protein
MPQHPPDNGEAILPLSAEDVSIEHRHIEQGVVNVRVQTNTREHLIDEQVARTRVAVNCVSIGRIVQAAPPMRRILPFA